MHQPSLPLMAAAIVIALSLVPATVMGYDLSPYRWQNRLLLVFAPEDTHPAYTAFDRELSAERAEIEERDLVVLRIFETDGSRIQDRRLDPLAAADLRRRFGVGPGGFGVTLIGKDGGVKLGREDRVNLREIFALIDSMPMRQREMREKNASK